MRAQAKCYVLVPLTVMVFITSGCGISIGAGVAASLLGKSSSSGNGGVPAPTITSISPATGTHAGGDLVTIQGENFSTDPNNLPTVSIGNGVATNVVVLDATRLQATTPPSATVGAEAVVVANPTGGTATLSGAYTFTNDTPAAIIPGLGSPLSGNIVFGVTISDPEADQIDLTLEYTTDGTTFQPIPQTDILSGSLSGLTSSATGVTHNLTWDSSRAFPAQDASNVQIRVTPIDTTDNQSGAFALSTSFDIANNGPPSVQITQPGNDSFEVGVIYRVADPNPTNALTVTSVTYSDLNLGTSGPATLKAGSAPAAVPGTVGFSASGTTHALVWDSFADVGFGNNRLMKLSITVSDGTQSVTATTASFFLSNGPFSDATLTLGQGFSHESIAVGDLNGDGLIDAITGVPMRTVRSLSLFLNSGQAFAPSTKYDLLGAPASIPITHVFTWNGTTTVTTVPDAAGLVVGDWIGLPYSFGGVPLGDPIGPRFFRISAVGAGTVTITDPYGYAGLGLLPGSAAFGGPVGLNGMTQFIKGPDPLADPLVPDLRPGELAVMPVDDDYSVGPISSDVVVVNRVPPLTQTALTAPANAGATTISVASIAPGFPPQVFEVGQLIAIGNLGAPPFDQAVIVAVGPGNTISFNPPLAIAPPWPAGTPVTALNSSAFFLAPGHAANHSFTVLPQQADGSLGNPTMTTPTGGLFPQDAIVGDLGAPGAMPSPDGIPDLVIVNAATTNVAAPLKGSVSIFLRNPAGPGFTPLPPIDVGQGSGTTPAGSVHGVIADVNSDTLPDVIVANAGESTVSVLVQGPPGTYTEAIIDLKLFGLPAGDTFSVAVGDVNQDGFPDLIATGTLSQTLLMLKGADPDGPGPLVSFPAGNPADPVVLVTQDPPPPATVAGAPTTQPAGTLYTSVQPQRVVLGDINSDGLPDLVVSEKAANSVAAFVNLGTNLGVTAFAKVKVTAGLQPTDLKIVDVNGDSRNDMLVLGSFLNDLARLHQTTPGTLDQFVSFPVGLEPVSVAIADVTSATPGNELVVTNNGQNSIHVLGRTGSASFTALSPFLPARSDIPTEFQLGSSVIPGPLASDPRTILPFVVALGDVNNDGQVDVAVTHQALIVTPPGIPPPIGTGAVAILLNQGGVAPIQTTTRVLQAQVTTLLVRIGDVVGNDGNQDVVVTNIDGPLGATGSIQIFAGDGTGNFAAPITFETPEVVQTSGLQLVDLDGDTDLDIVAGASANQNFVVLIQDPPGTMQPPVFGVPGGIPLAIAENTTILAVADLNNDGLVDVAFNDTSSSKVGVAFQQSPATTPPTFTTVLGLLSLQQPTGLIAGDLNSDGLPDLAIAFSASGKVGVYLQRPGTNKPASQALVAPFFLNAGPTPFDTQIGDLNGDGRNDLVVSSRGSGTINVFFQR